jgi:hypothetical protein
MYISVRSIEIKKGQNILTFSVDYLKSYNEPGNTVLIALASITESRTVRLPER